MEQLLAEIRNQQPDAVEPIEDLISIESIKGFSSWIEGRGYLDSGELSIEDIALAGAVEHRTVRNYIERLRQKGQWPYERHYITTTAISVGEDGIKRGNGTRVRYLKPEEVFKLLTETPLGRYWDPSKVLDDHQTREERSAQLAEDLMAAKEAARGTGQVVQDRRKWPELERVAKQEGVNVMLYDADQVAQEGTVQGQDDNLLTKVLKHKKAKQRPLHIPSGAIERAAESLERAKQEEADLPADPAEILNYYKVVADFCMLMRYSELWVREDDLVAMFEITKRWLKGKHSFHIHGLTLESQMVGMFKYWRAVKPAD